LKYCNFRFCGRHFGLLEGDGLIPIMLFCSPVIFRKSHQSTPLNSKRLQKGIENTGLGVNYPPMGLIRVNYIYTLRSSSRPLLDVTRIKTLYGQRDSAFRRQTLGTVFQRTFNSPAANCFGKRLKTFLLSAAVDYLSDHRHLPLYLRTLKMSRRRF